MKRPLYLILILLAIILTIPQIFAGYSWEETNISRVLTSNTFTTNNKGIIKIIGISPNNELSSDKREVCHTKSISREIKKFLLNKEILTATDEKNPRNIRHLKIDKEYVTEIFLRKGWAKMNDDIVSSYFQSRFKKAQEFAKNHQLGLWAPCPDDLNWQKIRRNFGGRMQKFKRNNVQFLGKVATGEVAEVLSGNEFRLKNGPIVKLQNVEIPRENNQASECFQKNSRNFLENLILGKKVRLEKPVNSSEIMNYKLIRNVFLIKEKKSREISVNGEIIADGFGKFSPTHPSSNLSEFELKKLEKVQAEVYANPRGAWKICARDILNTDFSNSKEENIKEIDENCPIKGNVSGTKSNPIKTYHTVSSGWYDRLQAEECFETEEEAIFAGFRKIR